MNNRECLAEDYNHPETGWYSENLAGLKLGSANFLRGADLSAKAGSAQNSGSHFELEAEFLGVLMSTGSGALKGPQKKLDWKHPVLDCISVPTLV